MKQLLGVLILLACACGKKDNDKPAPTPAKSADAAPVAIAPVDAAPSPTPTPPSTPSDSPDGAIPDREILIEWIVGAIAGNPDAGDPTSLFAPFEAAHIGCPSTFPDTPEMRADYAALLEKQTEMLKEAIDYCRTLGTWAGASLEPLQPQAGNGRPECPNAAPEDIATQGIPPGQEAAGGVRMPLLVKAFVIDGKRYIEKLRCE